MRAIKVEGHPAWLGRAGGVIGAATTVGPLVCCFRYDLFPGVLLYGLLVSVIVPLWGIASGITMWRRGKTASF
ncbi:hypothetical protein Psi02_54490 [Planotetraspora silvatica]|uniref:Uncharacterized protein n=1 Tax=Planotetraspora silvatica TaxID=234614 RepID=A0A8J3XQ97_9ACTN|nr:hypothetical protein Psi02_54490 [Planotetraspora silvatica]